MRLCTFTLQGEEKRRTGVVKEGSVVEVEAPGGMIGLLGPGAALAKSASGGNEFEMTKVRLRAPMARPGKILATIVNTQAMLGGDEIRLERPRIDMKAPSTVIGPGETVMAPGLGVRPEVELAAIIGKKLTRVTEEAARDGIAGFTILNDMTAPSDSRDDAYEAYRRDRATGTIRKTVMRGPLFRSKNHDTFCPMGPWVVTSDEVDVKDLKMTTKFDGDLVQEGSTSEYLFTPARIASYLSSFLTLEPGDVVSCGSVGWTREALGALDPTEYTLPRRDGTLELEIAGIGKLVNPVAFRS